MTVADLVDLHARVVRARAAWLRIEDLLAGVDDELDLEVAIARAGILQTKDRLEQLIDAERLEAVA